MGCIEIGLGLIYRFFQKTEYIHLIYIAQHKNNNFILLMCDHSFEGKFDDSVRMFHVRHHMPTDAPGPVL